MLLAYDKAFTDRKYEEIINRPLTCLEKDMDTRCNRSTDHQAHPTGSDILQLLRIRG